MSHVYDNWERLVAAVLKGQQYLKFCRSDSLSSSFNSVSSDFSSSFSSRLSFDLPAEQLPVLTPVELYIQHISSSRFSNSTSHLGLNSAPKLPKASAVNKIAGAARQFVTPAILRPQRKVPPSLHLIGLPNLGRSELEAACEDFSNVLIGSFLMYTLYKGTLSNGVEIAVQPTELYAKNWSNSLQAQFIKEIQKLSKVSHKNFVNIIGYCAGEDPFTRMVVFEYASNGVLFEYLHIYKEAERLDWAKRLRIVMGIAYCLESMHRMTPPLALRNLNSSNVFITEDYAAKLSDFFYLDRLLADVVEPDLQSNVYSFGVILLEMITGQLPYTTGIRSFDSDFSATSSFRCVDDACFTDEEVSKRTEIERLQELHLLKSHAETLVRAKHLDGDFTNHCYSA